MIKLLAEWFWVDRWMGSSAFGLPLEARGLYREMLSQAWRRGARLPNDQATIRRLTGCSEKEWRRSWPLVSPYWTVEGDALVNQTQVEVYAEAHAAKAAAVARAKAGAQGRAQARAQAPAQAPAQAVLEHPLKQCPPITDQVQVPPHTPPRGGAVERDPTRLERQWALDLRRRHGGCPHTPGCTDDYTCIGRLVGEKRWQERKGLAEGVA